MDRATMLSPVKKGLLVSDFNLANLCALLDNDPELPACGSVVAPFGQVGRF